MPYAGSKQQINLCTWTQTKPIARSQPAAGAEQAQSRAPSRPRGLGYCPCSYYFYRGLCVMQGTFISSPTVTGHRKVPASALLPLPRSKKDHEATQQQPLMDGWFGVADVTTPVSARHSSTTLHPHHPVPCRPLTGDRPRATSSICYHIIIFLYI